MVLVRQCFCASILKRAGVIDHFTSPVPTTLTYMHNNDTQHKCDCQLEGAGEYHTIQQSACSVSLTLT